MTLYARETGGTACRHWWLIEPQGAPTSAGRCKLCGEVRVFKNSEETDKGQLVTRSVALTAAGKKVGANGR